MLQWGRAGPRNEVNNLEQRGQVSIAKYFNRFANRVTESKRHHEADIIRLLSRAIADLEASVGTTTITNTTNIAGRNGATGVCGRLSASPTQAYWSADVTGAGVYFHPYQGNVVELYDGQRWQSYAFDDPVQYIVTASSHTCIDIFAYATADDEVALEGVEWTTHQGRAVNLDYQDAVLVKAGDPTRRYIGTIQVNAATGDKLQDLEALLGVWNYYHRLPRVLIKQKTGSWFGSAALRVLGGDATQYVRSLCGVADADRHVDSWVRAQVAQAESESVGGYFATIDFQVRAGIGISASTSDSSDYAGPHRQIMARVLGSAGGAAGSIYASAWSHLGHVKVGKTDYYALELIDPTAASGTNGGVRVIQWC